MSRAFVAVARYLFLAGGAMALWLSGYLTLFGAQYGFALLICGVLALSFATASH